MSVCSKGRVGGCVVVGGGGITIGGGFGGLPGGFVGFGNFV